MSEEVATSSVPEEGPTATGVGEETVESEAPSDPAPEEEEKNDNCAAAGGEGPKEDTTDDDGGDDELAAKVESMDVSEDDGTGKDATVDDGDEQPAGVPKTPSTSIDLPPIAPSLPVTNASRTASLSKLRAYEAARRSAYRTKLASSSLYWRSFRELLHASIEETERAEQILKASAESNTAYAISLRAAHNDTLDEQGRPVVDPKKRKKLMEGRERRREKASAGPAGTLLTSLESETDDGKSKTAAAAVSKLRVPDKSFSGRGNGILDALVESQGVMADRFAEYAKYVYDEAVPEIVEIRQALVMEVTLMEKMGDAIQEDLDAAEREVHDAWGECAVVFIFMFGLCHSGWR